MRVALELYLTFKIMARNYLFIRNRNFEEIWCFHHSKPENMGGKSGVNVKGCGANRGGRKVTEMEIDYYLASIGADSNKPSIKLRQKNELTRQRTSENRLFGLHFTAYPNALNEHSLTPRTQSEYDPTSTNGSAAGDTGASPVSVPRSESKSYPSLRSTNQVFNDVVIQSKKHQLPKFSLKDVLNQDSSTLPPQLAYAVTYDQGWSTTEKAEVKAARKLPYDSTLNSVLGRPKTVYRDEYCRKTLPVDFRDQILPASSADSDGSTHASSSIKQQRPPSPRRPGTARATLGADGIDTSHELSVVRTVRVGASVDGSDSTAPSWFGEPKVLSPSAPRAASARCIPRPPPSASPRKRLQVDVPAPASPRTVEGGDGDTFVILPRSYFTNRAKYTAT